MRLSDIYRDYLDTIESFSAEDWERITLEAERHTSEENELFDEDNGLHSLTDYRVLHNGYNATHIGILVVHLHMTKPACDEISYSLYNGEGEVA